MNDLPSIRLKETSLFRRVEVGDLEPGLGGAPTAKVIDLARHHNDKDGTLRIGPAPARADARAMLVDTGTVQRTDADRQDQQIQKRTSPSGLPAVVTYRRWSASGE